MSRREAGETKEEVEQEENTPQVDLDPTLFVNQGLARWESSRTQWLGHKSSESDSTVRAVAVPIEVDEIIDVVFSMPPQQPTTDANGQQQAQPPRKFPRNVPLPQMVDILVDLWEAEGLDI